MVISEHRIEIDELLLGIAAQTFDKLLLIAGKVLVKELKCKVWANLNEIFETFENLFLEFSLNFNNLPLVKLLFLLPVELFNLIAHELKYQMGLVLVSVFRAVYEQEQALHIILFFIKQLHPEEAKLCGLSLFQQQVNLVGCHWLAQLHQLNQGILTELKVPIVYFLRLAAVFVPVD